MAIRKVARMGHPILRAPTRELSKREILSDEMKRVVEDMVITMREYSGVGLAAPQVHEAIRLCVIEIQDENARYELDVEQPLLVIFNPTVTVLDATPFGFWEGCLSVPGLRGFVERPRKIRVDYVDQSATARSIVAQDFLSTVFQHELDHIEGKLYVDKVKDPARFAFIEEYQRYHMDDGAEAID